MAPQDEHINLNGKVAVVTGGNSGIGYTTIQMLCRKGVYMGARDEGRASAAIKKLEEEGLGGGSVHWLKLDLSSVSAAVAAAEELLQKETRLDILVNNAARQVPGPFEIDAQGLRDIMAVNHVAPFAFTEALLPLLERTAKEDGSDVRVVNVSSMGHTGVAPVTFASIEALNQDFGASFMNSVKTYGLSKLANILHIKNLQQRLKQRGVQITCIALHPGVVRTPATAGMMKLFPVLGWVAYRLAFSSADVGGNSILFAAAGKAVAEKRELYEGGYLVPTGKLVKPSASAQSTQLATELYVTSKKVVDELLDSAGRPRIAWYE
ncbi:hypothetical protein HMN09_00246900 [Mycena chlorophos]|uniref:NAD(P)-binding protein n=1 Tax=Mycena chlorophos TaxID=658473 RepID=A0A8H6TLZ6_MYCCL|nr:hypothetical protein HMN09_00246900 [Mycena chlorophos]